MYIFEMQFIPREGVHIGDDANMLTSKISWFLLLCRHSGQSLGYQIRCEDKPFSYFVYAPEVDALEEKNDAPYVARDRAQLKEYFDISLTLLDSGSKKCACSARIGIEMRTDRDQGEGPFVCLSCGRTIPLYRLPAFEGGGFDDTLNWQDAFAAMLALNNTVMYDEFTSDQLLRYDSKLNEEGRRLAKKLGQQVDAPVYYRLYEIDETFKQQPRQNVDGIFVRICPCCGKTMERLPIAEGETIEVCKACGLSSAEEVLEW